MTILAISSQVVAGHVGNSAAQFVLQTLGHEVWAIPTVLLSHHPGHSTPAGRSTPAAEIDALLELSLIHISMRPEGALGAVTAEYKINILRPSVGERAIVRANIIRRGKTQAVTEAKVSCTSGGEEKLVAVALATISYLYP